MYYLNILYLKQSIIVLFQDYLLYEITAINLKLKDVEEAVAVQKDVSLAELTLNYNIANYE